MNTVVLRNEFLALLDSLNCDYLERNGEVWVLTPEKRLYRYSAAQEMTGAELSQDIVKWILEHT